LQILAMLLGVTVLLVLTTMGQAAGNCSWTLRVAGALTPISQAPEQGRYIISCSTEQSRQQLLQHMAAALPDARAAPLTDTMPLLTANLTRAGLQWLCQDVQASACIDYIERDEPVSLY
jgi:hypothetical protein